MRIIEIDLDTLDEDLADFLLLTGTVKTKEDLVREVILRVIDPLPLSELGACFEFEPRPEGECYLSLEVPPPNADVDIVRCWRIAQADARACEKILDRNSSIEELVRVYGNGIQWLEFWKRRFPSKSWREKFSVQLDRRRAGLEALKETAKYRIRPDIVEELEAI